MSERIGNALHMVVTLEGYCQAALQKVKKKKKPSPNPVRLGNPEGPHGPKLPFTKGSDLGPHQTCALESPLDSVGDALNTTPFLLVFEVAHCQ